MMGSKVAALLDRLLITTQDMFIFQALESGMTVHPIKTMVRVSTDRVTRISKLRPKRTMNSDGAHQSRTAQEDSSQAGRLTEPCVRAHRGKGKCLIPAEASRSRGARR